MINTLHQLKSLMTDMDQSRPIYWHNIYRLIPLINYSKQYIYQKDFAREYLNLHPAKLSAFLSMIKGFTPPQELYKTFDIDALKRELDGLY